MLWKALFKHSSLLPHSLLLRCRWQPVDLLPRSIQEFATSSRGLGTNRDTLRAVYEEYDSQRVARLQAARQEREKLIRDEQLPLSGSRRGQRKEGMSERPPKPAFHAWSAVEGGGEKERQKETLTVSFRKPEATVPSAGLKDIGGGDGEERASGEGGREGGTRRSKVDRMGRSGRSHQGHLSDVRMDCLPERVLSSVY